MNDAHLLESIASRGISLSGIRSNNFKTSIGVNICRNVEFVMAVWISGFVSIAMLNSAEIYFNFFYMKIVRY